MARVALLQTTSGIDPAANARALVAGLEAAAAGGATIAFTPEMTGLIDRDRARAAGAIVAEEHDVVLAAARAAAARLGLWVHLGSLALRPGGGETRYVNRAFLIDDSGSVRARYDKLHLFDVDLATGERWRESAAYAPGDGAVVADTPAGRLGLSICYDLRFPDLYRALSDAGAEIFAIPAAFTVPTGEAHWHVLLRARAIEAGCFVIAAAQTGHHEDGRFTYGHALAIDPWGRVLLDMGEAPGVGFAEIDLALLDDVRARIPALKHRRPIPRSLARVIVFDLNCGAGHVFEAWFGSHADYDDQRARGLVACPVCGDATVDKAPMAPRISGAGEAATIDPRAIDPKAMLRTMMAVQARMLSGSEDVGPRFADEARAIHSGDAEHRVIHGQATAVEAKALVADGVPVAPLPFPVRDASRDN